MTRQAIPGVVACIAVTILTVLAGAVYFLFGLVVPWLGALRG